MSYLNKQYIALTGHDFTQWVNTEEDAKIFEEMCEHERQTLGVPIKDCVQHVADAINLGNKLQGKNQKVLIINNPLLN